MNQMHGRSGAGGTWDHRYGAPGAAPSWRPRVEPGGVPPGETPPGESSVEEAVPQQEYMRSRGWAAAPLTVIMILVVLVAGFFLAYAIALMV
ncbi:MULTISPECIES: DUF6480 family protein [unclassified Streptomyces]|jgi:hypothetical protein|uniref:DUF6480 family protein n=2 Tax=Streptomyces TaxID=1883 RepID=UPI0035AB9C97